jgi:HEAT repeat protein
MSKIPDESPKKENLELLIETLKNNPDWNKRFGAASKLFQLGKEKAVDPFINTLQNDPHPEMRRFVTVLLGKIGDTRATWALIAALREALQQNNSIMITNVTKALLEIGGRDLPSILTSTIEDTEEFYEMRLLALEILRKIGDSNSIQGLINIITNPNTDGKIRAKAIEELIYSGNLAGLQLILELLQESNHRGFQKLVIQAFGKTPFKNKTIILRIGEVLLSIMEKEEQKKKEKDEELTKLVAKTLKQLATNIDRNFKEFLDEIIKIRRKQKKIS